MHIYDPAKSSRAVSQSSIASSATHCTKARQSVTHGSLMLGSYLLADGNEGRVPFPPLGRLLRTRANVDDKDETGMAHHHQWMPHRNWKERKDEEEEDNTCRNGSERKSNTHQRQLSGSGQSTSDKQRLWGNDEDAQWPTVGPNSRTNDLMFTPLLSMAKDKELLGMELPRFSTTGAGRRNRVELASSPTPRHAGSFSGTSVPVCKTSHCFLCDGKRHGTPGAPHAVTGRGRPRSAYTCTCKSIKTRDHRNWDGAEPLHAVLEAVSPRRENRPVSNRNKTCDILHLINSTSETSDNCYISTNSLNEPMPSTRKPSNDMYREASVFVVPPSATHGHGTATPNEPPIAHHCGSHGHGEEYRSQGGLCGQATPRGDELSFEEDKAKGCDTHQAEALGSIPVPEKVRLPKKRSMVAMVFLEPDHPLPHAVDDSMLTPPFASVSVEHVSPTSHRVNACKRNGLNSLDQEHQRPRNGDQHPLNMEMSSILLPAGKNSENNSPSMSTTLFGTWSELNNECTASELIKGNHVSQSSAELPACVICPNDSSRLGDRSLDSRTEPISGARPLIQHGRERYGTACRMQLVRSPMNFTMVSDALEPLPLAYDASLADLIHEESDAPVIPERPKNMVGQVPPTPMTPFRDSNRPGGRSPSLFTPKHLAVHHHGTWRGMRSSGDAKSGTASRERVEGSGSTSQNAQQCLHYSFCNQKDQQLEWTIMRENSEGMLSLLPDNASPLFSGLMLNFAPRGSEASSIAVDNAQSTSSNGMSKLLFKVCRGMEWRNLQMPSFQLDQ
uniref:Uncharacterized protein n=1 Tax=Trypanosoma congolense (strain IL3000) TaxID=1068625 RepID=G0UN57_TRYCI|nr:conserved hypothetical protein [Trypanosoma congolense IL3000]